MACTQGHGYVVTRPGQNAGGDKVQRGGCDRVSPLQ